jgi:signal peptidase II
MLVAVTFLITLLLDQLTKYMVVKNFSIHQSVPIIKNVFHLTYIQNRGAAFGLLQGQLTFFIIVTLFVVGALILFYRELPLNNFFNRIALGLALGGSIGNLIDRIRVGHVIDFLDFRIWPVFNLADSAIVVAVCIFGYWMLVIDPE